jgi:ferredoxin
MPGPVDARRLPPSAQPDVRGELRINWLLCDGYGLCSDLLPQIIDLDDWNFPIIRPGEVPAELAHNAQRAVDCCPMKALSYVPVRADEVAGRRGSRGHPTT